MVSRFKPSAPIIALSPNEGTVKHLELSYGVKPFLIEKLSGIDESMTFIPAFLKAKKLGKKGDKIVVTAGVPFNVSGSTNLLFVLTL
jgi:pyruvate kinase